MKASIAINCRTQTYIFGLVGGRGGGRGSKLGFKIYRDLWTIYLTGILIASAHFWGPGWPLKTPSRINLTRLHISESGLSPSFHILGLTNILKYTIQNYNLKIFINFYISISNAFCTAILLKIN